MALPGFPIRKSADRSRMCRSPQLIAACHVLLRLLMPRHSPCALSSLTFLSAGFFSSPTDLVWFSYFRIMQAIFQKFLKLLRLRLRGDALPFFKKFHNFRMMPSAFVNSAPASQARDFTPSPAGCRPLITKCYRQRFATGRKPQTCMLLFCCLAYFCHCSVFKVQYPGSL